MGNNTIKLKTIHSSLISQFQLEIHPSCQLIIIQIIYILQNTVGNRFLDTIQLIKGKFLLLLADDFLRIFSITASLL